MKAINRNFSGALFLVAAIVMVLASFAYYKIVFASNDLIVSNVTGAVSSVAGGTADNGMIFNKDGLPIVAGFMSYEKIEALLNFASKNAFTGFGQIDPPPPPTNPCDNIPEGPIILC